MQDVEDRTILQKEGVTSMRNHEFGVADEIPIPILNKRSEELVIRRAGENKRERERERPRERKKDKEKRDEGIYPLDAQFTFYIFKHSKMNLSIIQTQWIPIDVRMKSVQGRRKGRMNPRQGITFNCFFHLLLGNHHPVQQLQAESESKFVEMEGKPHEC